MKINIPLFLTLLNIITCFFSFICIVFPNFYFGLEGLNYILFWGIFSILFLLHIIIFLVEKQKKYRILYPLSVVILYLGLLLIANVI